MDPGVPNFIVCQFSPEQFVSFYATSFTQGIPKYMVMMLGNSELM